MADQRLFIYSTLLISVGVVMSYSLSSYAVIFYGYSQFHFLIRELIAAVLGLCIMWALSHINVEKHFCTIGFCIFILFCMATIILPFVPDSFATSAGGAKRWFRLPGFSLSPVEPLKVGYIFFLAWSFSRKFANSSYNLVEQVLIVIPHMFVFSCITVVIVFFQNDLGQVILLGLALTTMLIFAGGSFQLFGLVFTIFGAVGSIGILTSPHRVLRFKAWWAGVQDTVLSFMPKDMAGSMRVDNLPEPYQIHNAANAFYNGGYFGVGLGEGTIKLGFLSDVHTDMVLAGISEELGMFGLGACVFLLFLLIFRIFRISFRLKDKLHYLFCVGISVLIGLSFVINSFGVAGITPIKGMAVPFLSYGGSSLISVCIAMGLVLSLSKKVTFN